MLEFSQISLNVILVYLEIFNSDYLKMSVAMMLVDGNVLLVTHKNTRV